MTDPSDLIVFVTGGSRGIGRGAAAELARAGAHVYATGRSISAADLPENVTRIECDHLDDAAVAVAFSRVKAAHGQLDILVNAAWGGYERMVENGAFTWPLPFWDQPLWRWQAMMDVGVRAAFVASQEAARLMVPHQRGLIVHVSQWAAQKYLGNVIYGISKAATDKMAADMAVELAQHGVSVISLYPGLVRTEAVLAAGVFDLSNSESPEFIGRVVAALYGRPDLLERSGRVLVAAQVARELGVQDVDGRSPEPYELLPDA